jgi:hypothetical protein
VKRSALKLALWLVTSVPALSASPPASASGEIGLGASYDARVPVGSFRDFVGDPSWQGFQASLDYFVTDWLSLGAAGQYSLFQEQFPTQTLAISNGAITAQTFRYASSWSIFGVPRVYFLPHHAVRPFVALGVGPVNVTHTAVASDIAVHDESWNLLLQPAVGAYFRLGPNARYGLRQDPAFGLVASLSYAFTTASFLNVSSLSYMGLQFGVYTKY